MGAYPKISGAAALLGLALTYAWAVPAGFNIQGRLTDANGVNRDGTFQMKFSVYSTDIGGVPAWEKNFSAVNVKNGNFSVILQGTDDNSTQLEAAVKSLEAAYVEIKVGSDPPLVPRQPLLRSPFSSSDMLSGRTDVLVQSDNQVNGTGLIALRTGNSDRVTILNNGNVGVGTSTPDKKLVVAGDAEVAGNLAAANFVGAVMWFYRAACPAGFLKADGRLVSQSDYPALAAATGNAGDFNLPDLRGEFIRGVDERTDPTRADPEAPRVVGSMQSYQVETHRHGTDMYGPRPAYGTANQFISIDPQYGVMRYTTNYGGAETRPRNIALLPCLKY